MDDRKIKQKKRFSTNAVLISVEIVLVVLILTAAMFGSLAYYVQNTSTLANKFTFGIPKVVVNEPGVDPEDVAWGTDTKPVTFSIPTDSPKGVVRALIIPVFKDSSGNVISSSSGTLEAPVSNALVLGDITLHYAAGWNTNWLFKEGFFYYKKVLNSGETTTQLLSGVTLTSNTPEMRAKYQNVTVEIEVLSEVLQASSDALVNWGITLDSSGNIA